MQTEGAAWLSDPVLSSLGSVARRIGPMWPEAGAFADPSALGYIAASLAVRGSFTAAISRASAATSTPIEIPNTTL